MSDIGNLNLNLLRVFAAVYETGNVTAAAERLGMSQSAVSGNMARLSAELGQVLFERRRNGVQATEAAQRLYGPITDALHAFSSGLMNAPGGRTDTAPRHFRIALQNLAEATICGPALDELNRVLPEVTIEIVPPSTIRIEPELLAGTLDLAFHVGSEAPSSHPDIVVNQANVSHWVCITRQGWSADHGPLDVAKMDRFGVVALDIGRNEDIPVMHHASRNMVPPVCTVDRGWAIPAIIARSDHVAAVPLVVAGTMAERFGLELHRIPFDYHPLPFFLMWHRRSHDDHLHQQFRTILVRAGQPQRARIHSLWQHLIGPG